MTSTNLSPKQLNFAQISIVCVDILKQCLIDILDIHIKPTDLSKEIHLSQSLKSGKDKLNSEQRDLCCVSSLRVPDYSKFDVTLLYRLIRNLCPTLKPSKDWGKEPKTTDLTIGDDIERIRLFRNKHFAHAESAKIPDSEFTDLWNEGKSLIHRIQIFTTANGCTTDYGLKLTNISGRMIKYEEYTSYVNLFRAISIEKDVEVTCGDTAHFKADTRLEESAFLSISWEKVDGSARKHIDISCEKYKGSTSRQLFIHSVCKEDEGGYQAVISKNIDHKIFSNIGFLKTQGELPLLDSLKVSTTKEEICIHYSHSVLENSPRINDIKWTKNKTPLDLTNKKYCGGNVDNSVLKITCPTKEDRGEYSCTVSNAVGSVLQIVTLDEPSAKISTNTPVIHGSETRFTCLISSCPFPEQIEWQKSCDGNTFHRVDINELKYHGSYEDPSSPVLCLPKTTFDDQQFYRIAVRNKIGECMSNTHFLEVVGERPIIINATCTTKDQSVRLNCDVLLYDKSPALQDVYWTKKEQKVDIQGSGGKYSGVSTDDPSLTISNVNKHDAGNYQLTAINSVGTTKSDVIVLGVPDVVLERTNKYEDGSHCFMVTIKSNPAPFFVKWSMKDKESETLQQINVNADEYKGTSTSFPHPMLVVKNPETLENYCFQIKAKNVFGFTEKVIPDETNPVISISDDNTVENLNKIYERRGRNIMFGKVFDELAEKFPEAKIGRLKDLIQNSCEVEDVTFLKQANSARDCFRILKFENIFTPEDVIFVQYLLKMTECEELETKCTEYAKSQNARYYYEKPPDNGYKNVHVHVVANIGCYRTENITKVRETVAAIVGCTIEEVLVNGYLHSASFILVLSIKNTFVQKLLALKRKDKDTLSKLSIDYFKIDSTIIHLKGLRDETNPILLKSDDNTVNVGNLNRINERRGRNIRFDKDFDKLAGQFLEAKISRLEDRFLGNYGSDVKMARQFTTLRMKNVPRLSRSVYEGLCEKVGNSTKVNFRREVIDITEDLLSTSNVFFDNRCYKFKLSGSVREGFRLKTSDIDMLGWCLSDKVVFNPSHICLNRNPHHTVILMECDDLSPGFTRLKLIVPGHVFHEISCVEINDELYVPNCSFTKNMGKTLESTDFKRTFYYEPAIAMVSALLKTDIDFCFKSDHWPDTAKPLIQRCQQSGWPVETVVSQIVNSGCHVVPIGSTSDENLEWRISFSNAEQMIVYSLNHCQFICYGLLKIFLKEVINEQSKSPILCSYFMKTVLFWVIQNDRTLQWTPENLLCCYWNCFKLLIHWVNKGCCPNFFIPQNNMFRLKVTGHAQAALLDQLYDFYANGIDCLCLSPTIKLYLYDAIINKNLPFMQETSIYLNDVYVLEELHAMGKIVTPLTVKNLEEAAVLMNRIEKFLKGNITKYQSAIVQYMTTCMFRYAGLILQRMLQKIMCRKRTYLTKKLACSMFKFSSAIGSVPEHLYLAMYYYGNGQYEQSLRCTQRARPYSVEVKSFNAMMRKCIIYNINLGNADTFFSELVIEQNANEEISGKYGELVIPFDVMLHMMLILNYHKLGARAMSQQSLQDLRTLLHCGKRLSFYNDPYDCVLYADISWQILGICQHICGDYFGALKSYQLSLKSKARHRIHRATYLRMLLSLFALTRIQMVYRQE